MKEKIINILRSKFFVAFMLFFIWVTFFDENNIVERFKLIKQYNQLIEDKVYYTRQIEKDSKRLEELQTNNDNLEKFAREEYFMKGDNEDVYVIVRE